ncbi:MAG: CAAX prenyl protease-related protein [Acidobacteriaceae bacterium]|nr:CAAX prenyl protease-related protein [Acidobacteriaceae bacterium]
MEIAQSRIVPSGHAQRSLRYIAPFALFVIALGISQRIPLSPAVSMPLWFVVFAPLCIFCWPREISAVPKYAVASTAIGLIVFLLWIAPELLIPGYRNLPLFSNSIVGHVHSSLPADALRSPWVIAWRTARAVLIVPVVEELFWRGWLMRWLIDPNFERIPLGAYAPLAFWVTAVMFASEHGPYWDVGLITGIIYNFWMMRSKSLADCVLMHAVTNAVLSGYVIVSGQWQYWQ